MELSNIIDIAQTGAAGLLVILIGMVRIPKIDINLWSLLARTLGRALNKEIMEKVDRLTKELEDHMKAEDEEKARNARQRFLRFNDELLEGKKHTKEHFDEVLGDIDLYLDYCLEHPAYENSKAELAIANIKKIYQECLEESKFLG